jgi:hypothetical protein
LSRGRRRERGRLLPWPLVADRDCGLGLLVKITKLFYLPFEV